MSTTAERYVHSCVSAASAFSATDPRPVATRRFAQAMVGMTTSESAVMARPIGLLCGSSLIPSSFVDES